MDYPTEAVASLRNNLKGEDRQQFLTDLTTLIEYAKEHPLPNAPSGDVSDEEMITASVDPGYGAMSPLYGEALAIILKWALKKAQELILKG